MGNLTITSAWKTEKGRRPSNEDACLVMSADELGGALDGLFIVADGMGGRASGDIASTTAVNTLRDVFLSEIGKGNGDVGGALARSLRAANSAVYREANAKPDLQGMGTTCVAAAIQDGTAFLAHLGDSRAYLLRGGDLRRLTEDHSFVAEKVKSGEITEDQAKKSRFRNVITRAVGLEPDAEPETSSVELRSGDALLLCTDGLTIPVSEAEIASILSDSADADEACDRLVGTALRTGGHDNITVVLAEYGGRTRPARRETVQAGRRGVSILLGILGLILGLAAGIYGGYSILPRYIKPEPVKKVSTQSSLASVEYEDPVSLLHIPLQGRLLAPGRRGGVYVADLQGRLMHVDASGAVTQTFPSHPNLKPVTSPASAMVASDRQGNLYMSDPAAKRIVKFDNNGLFLKAIGAGKLSRPEALCVDRSGNIFVIDNSRLKVIRAKKTLGDAP